MFQRPERASSISTKEVEKMGRHKTSGFNALNGLLPFLPDWRRQAPSGQ